MGAGDKGPAADLLLAIMPSRVGAENAPFQAGQAAHIGTLIIGNSHRDTQRTKGTKKAPIHFSLTEGKSILLLFPFFTEYLRVYPLKSKKIQYLRVWL